MPAPALNSPLGGRGQTARGKGWPQPPTLKPPRGKQQLCGRRRRRDLGYDQLFPTLLTQASALLLLPPPPLLLLAPTTTRFFFRVSFCFKSLVVALALLRLDYSPVASHAKAGCRPAVYSFTLFDAGRQPDFSPISDAVRRRPTVGAVADAGAFRRQMSRTNENAKAAPARLLGPR